MFPKILGDGLGHHRDLELKPSTTLALPKGPGNQVLVSSHKYDHHVEDSHRIGRPAFRTDLLPGL